MKRTAIFSPCRRYRYLLTREWNIGAGRLLLIGLNPSTAGALHDDPTIRRCINFAASWGFGALYVANLFAFMVTEPAGLLACDEPVGLLNDYYIRKLNVTCDQTVVAWGNHGVHLERNLQVLKFIDKPYCLKGNKNGQPAHPLYQKAGTQLKVFEY